ncbi:uncharacterized protein LOC131605365 [Vicia villosa]|uniref:uncharacterized protein LOC131605365 n=1 Tax=Vicia villosa TaxID=3911 RepID=UPI00273B2536|nr:uncharacterized protein LOC131605365 [Vicia villosa]
MIAANLLPSFMALRTFLEAFGDLNGEKDTVDWKPVLDKGYSVASFYASYALSRIPYGPLNRHDEALEWIWKMAVPFKMNAFGWRLLVNRLPTKDLLLRRGISLSSSSSSHSNCIYCELHKEDRDHMFFGCSVIILVWKEIVLWVDFPGRFEDLCISSFMDLYTWSCVKRIKDGKLGVLWLATSWIIWLTRNEFCFRNEIWNISNIVWNIKILVWRWSFFGDIAHPNIRFYDFVKDPLSFMS